jgi:SAM-dependent methyltransferase
MTVQDDSFLTLFELRCVSSMRRAIEECRVIKRYYPFNSFWKIDLALKGQYLWQNAFRVSKQHQRRREAQDLYVYGDTPLTTLEKIVAEAAITAADTFFDLGCGSARTSFWLQHFVGCHVVGIDWAPTFIRRAQRVQQRLKLEGLTFCEEDMLKVDYRKATAVYLYGTCLDDETIVQLIEQLRLLPEGAKVISVSYPLTDYAQAEGLFEVEKSFLAPFGWGEAEVFIQRRC